MAHDNARWFASGRRNCVTQPSRSVRTQHISPGDKHLAKKSMDETPDDQRSLSQQSQQRIASHQRTSSTVPPSSAQARSAAISSAPTAADTSRNIPRSRWASAVSRTRPVGPRSVCDGDRLPRRELMRLSSGIRRAWRKHRRRQNKETKHQGEKVISHCFGCYFRALSREAAFAVNLVEATNYDAWDHFGSTRVIFQTIPKKIKRTFKLEWNLFFEIAWNWNWLPV